MQGQRRRLAASVRATAGLAACESDTLWLWMCDVFVGAGGEEGGSQLHERGLAELHGNTKSLSASWSRRRGSSLLASRLCLSRKLVHFLYSSISIIFSIYLGGNA